MICPPYLKSGDHVGIISTSNFTEQVYIDKLVSILVGWGLKPVLGKTVGPRKGSFAGSDKLRLKDLQEMIDNDQIKAVLETMGGYGIVRIIDQVDFNKFKYAPKWIAGYSDTTFLHSHLQGMLNIATLQATMAADLKEDYYERSWESLRKALFGEKLEYKIKHHPLNRSGSTEATLVGGTLSILCNAKGTISDVNTNGKILFLEEVGEHYFRMDSYLTSLKKANKFEYVKGLIIGQLTDMQEDDPPFGRTPEEIIRDCVEEFDFPICFGFPAGHGGENMALIFGGRVNFKVNASGATVDFLDYNKETINNAQNGKRANGKTRKKNVKKV